MIEPLNKTQIVEQLIMPIVQSEFLKDYKFSKSKLQLSKKINQFDFIGIGFGLVSYWPIFHEISIYFFAHFHEYELLIAKFTNGRLGNYSTSMINSNQSRIEHIYWKSNYNEQKKIKLNVLNDNNTSLYLENIIDIEHLKPEILIGIKNAMSNEYPDIGNISSLVEDKKKAFQEFKTRNSISISLYVDYLCAGYCFDKPNLQKYVENIEAETFLNGISIKPVFYERYDADQIEALTECLKFCKNEI